MNSPMTRPQGRPWTVIGHRGACGHAPENTLLSIDTAIRLGAPWVEFDVQHHDGELWLMHDLRLERTTNGSGLLTDHSAAALRELDAGQGEQIPTLTEALDLIEQRIGVNIELKSWSGCAERVADCLRNYLEDGWDVQRFMVSSFHLPELWEFHQLLPDVPIATLHCGVPLDWAGETAELGAGWMNVSAEFVDAKLLEDAHERGIGVNVYTVNDADDLKRLHALGVDGVFTNYPERALALIA